MQHVMSIRDVHDEKDLEREIERILDEALKALPPRFLKIHKYIEDKGWNVFDMEDRVLDLKGEMRWSKRKKPLKKKLPSCNALSKLSKMK